MKYRDAYPNSLGDGVGLISELSSFSDIPWFLYETDIKATIERLYNVRSGFKEVLDTFLSIPEDKRASLLMVLYREKWKRLWDNYKLSYDPLSAYTMSETTKSTKKVESTRQVNYGKVVDHVSNESGTVKDEGNTSDNTNSSVYGFNSIAAVPSNTENGTTTNANTETRDLDNTGQVTNSGTDTHTNNSSDTDDIIVNKNGNIGYTTPQELIRQEFEIWGTAYFSVVFDDIDQFITIQVY